MNEKELALKILRKVVEENFDANNPAPELEIKEEEILINSGRGSKLSMSFELILDRLKNPASLELLFKNTLTNPPLVEDLNSLSKNWEMTKHFIFPLLKNSNQIIQYPNMKLVSEQSPIPELAITYVIDSNDSMAFLSEGMLSDWGIEVKEMKKQAFRNLKKLYEKKGLLTDKSEGGFFLFSNREDGYDATRILSLDYRYLKGKVKGEVLIGIPNRDMLVVFGSEESIADRFVFQNAMAFRDHRYALTPNTFIWKDGKEFIPFTNYKH